MSNEPLFVCIADDHYLVRYGIRKILEKYKECVVYEACNKKETIDILFSQPVDLLMLDINLPDGSGLEVLKELKDYRLNTPVLILSMYTPEQYAIRAFRSGARGYLSKDATPDEIIHAVNEVIHGRRYINPQYSGSIISRLASDENEKRPHQLLSNQEFSVFIRLAQGDNLRSIAEQMNISVKTVSTYQSRIFEKMGLNSIQELITYAIKNGLIEI